MRKPSWDAKKGSDERWLKYTCEEFTMREQTDLDVLWPKDQSRTDVDNLPEPDEPVEEVTESLEAVL